MTPPEQPQSFLQRRPLRRALRRAVANWLERHQHPFNRRIHFIGIPLALIAAPLLLALLPWDEWYWAAAAFVMGYVLQWLGHHVEGNDVGEWAAIKRALGLPYVAIAPRWQRDSAACGLADSSAPALTRKRED